MIALNLFLNINSKNKYAAYRVYKFLPAYITKVYLYKFLFVVYIILHL